MSNRRFVVVLVVALTVALACAAGGYLLLRRTASGHAVSDPAAVRFHCPMHPTVVSDRPGDCPICGMRLVPIEPEPEPEPEPATEHASDRAAVRIPRAKQQLIGVKTEEVGAMPFTRVVRAVARLTYDETRLRHVHTKIGGFVEVLHANATGELVRRGEPLLEIYSPELLASQQEYLVARKARERTAASTLPSVAATGDELVASARRRLELFDLDDEQIRELETTGVARRTVTVHAPISGFVLKRNVTQGERIEPGTTLLEVVDLSSVWAIASVYGNDVPFVRVGQPAAVSLSYLPGRTFAGRVSFISPTLEPTTRTVEVRIALANPGLELKPEMYGEARLEANLGPRLAVAESAVIETGRRSIVFVDKGSGLFEPREIRIGLRRDDVYEVLDGLVPGERVLTSGTFLVDSESKIKAALASMTEPAPDTSHAH